MLFKSGGVDRIVVFLGNPGTKYTGTRHNAGFLTADELCRKLNTKADRLRFRALTGRCVVEGESVLLMKPQTYMNLSGESVGEAARFYKIPADRILVVSDDIALPCGRLRVRTKGSAGGHNGLKNIIQHLGTEEFPRIRVGVGAPPDRGPDQVDWVLGVPRNEDAELFSAAIQRAADCVCDFIRLGPEKTMERYNRN